MDIGFLVDSSNAVSQQNWNRLKSFAKNMVDSFNPSWSGNHIGFMSYDNMARLHFAFNALRGDRYTAKGVKRLMDNVKFQQGGARRIDTALNTAYRDLFSISGGYRPNARQVKMVTTSGIVSMFFEINA